MAAGKMTLIKLSIPDYAFKMLQSELQLTRHNDDDGYGTV